MTETVPETDDLIAKLKSQIGDDVQQIYDHEALFKEAAAEVVRLRKALGLYANPQNWKMSAPCDPNGPNFIGEEHARAALEGGKEPSPTG